LPPGAKVFWLLFFKKVTSSLSKNPLVCLTIGTAFSDQDYKSVRTNLMLSGARQSRARFQVTRILGGVLFVNHPLVSPPVERLTRGLVGKEIFVATFVGILVTACSG
jgi:hypothetical protein